MAPDLRSARARTGLSLEHAACVPGTPIPFEQAGEACVELRLRQPQLGREASVAQLPGAFTVAEAEDIEQRLFDVVLA